MSDARAFSPSATLAPWAEIVSGAPRMTVDEVDALPDDGWQYELVDGVLVRMPLSGGQASKIAARLGGRLTVFVEEHVLGETTGADGGYRPDPEHPEETELGPDVAFVRAGRAPAPTSPEYARAWLLAPDLVVEVAAPNQYRPVLAEKATRYLSFGTRLVWVVWPRVQQVDVWRPGDKQPSATLGVRDVLDGEDVVPGFTYAIASLFA